MAVVTAPPSAHEIIQVVNESNLNKIESFLNDTAYREAIENSSNYNSRLCRERRLRMPFLDSQTGVAQNHSALFMSARERLPGLLHGQIYTYPSKRWRKKRRQYLMHYLHPKRTGRGDTEDGIEGTEGIVPGVNDDSKDSSALKGNISIKDEHSKDAWYYDEQDMLDMDAFEEPDPDSDYDYEESYSSKRKRRRTRGGAHHPNRSHPPSTDSPGSKRAKGGGRGRKKANYDAVDSDKPFVCDRGTRRGRQNTASSSTSTPSPAAPTAPAAGAPPPQTSPVPQQQPPPPVAANTTAASATSTAATSTVAAAAAATAAATAAAAAAAVAAVAAATSSSSSAPTSPVPTPKEDHSPAVASPGAVPSPSSGKAEGGPPTPGGNEKKLGKAAQPSPYCDFCLGDARENKKTGGSEELVSCSDCGRSGHPTCLQFTANMIVSVRKYRWQCIECKCCSICGTSDNDDQLLFCDDCDRGYHMYCLSPPLASPPEGSWSCRLCIAEFHRRD
ncbi:zinc finger protein DPF3 isoform X3 [Orussus abietinus]|uniref:zinc finger protein DPF3 isoform X3 n=1 Tax=Orussus abietinus TaxID=222816 RepID=UPI00062695BD|nr:zinc finger protein DPF3 isoform X3 [Orussus abietinus]